MSVNRGTTSTENVKDGKCKMWIKGRQRIINLHVLFPHSFLFCLSWFKTCLHLEQEKMDRETIKACLLGNGSYVLHRPLTSPGLPWKCNERQSFCLSEWNESPGQLDAAKSIEGQVKEPMVRRDQESRNTHIATWAFDKQLRASCRSVCSLFSHFFYFEFWVFRHIITTQCHCDSG